MPGKNKYITFLFIAVFMLSGTGLPMIVHLCNTMNEVSFESCGMCETHKIPEGPSFSRINDCCNTTELSASVTDQYINSKTQFDVQAYTIEALPFVLNTEKPKTEFSSIYIGESPPLSKDTPLFILNSIFLI